MLEEGNESEVIFKNIKITCRYQFAKRYHQSLGNTLPVKISV